MHLSLFFFFQAEDGIRDLTVTGDQTCALPIFRMIHRLPSTFHSSPAARFACACARLARFRQAFIDRKSVVQGKSVDLGGRRIIKKKKGSRRWETKHYNKTSS